MLPASISLQLDPFIIGECLKQVAGQLECLARANHQLEAVALLQDLEHAWRELRDALGAFLKSPPLC